VGRIRISYPVIAASKYDATLRALLLTELLSLAAEDGETVYVPDGLTVVALPVASYRKLREVYMGVTKDNLV
jgi:hypothetical protein